MIIAGLKVYAQIASAVIIIIVFPLLKEHFTVIFGVPIPVI